MIRVADMDPDAAGTVAAGTPVRRMRGFVLPTMHKVPARAVSDAGIFTSLLAWTPVFWLLGALTLAQAAVVMRLAWRRWPRDRLVNLVVAMWMCVAATQATASILNGVYDDMIGLGLRNAVAMTVLGWIFGGLAIAAGAAHRLNDARAVRAVARLGLYVLLLGAASVIIWRVTHLPNFTEFDTPVEMLAPSSDVVRFYASAQFYQHESTFGDALMRLVLFFPWTTALGMGGLGIFLISTLERDLLWRLTGIAGGLVAVVFSWSRIAQVSLILAIALLLFMRLRGRGRVVLLSLLAIGLAALPMAGINPLTEAAEARGAVDAARAGSSLARELIYSKSWDGFLASPVIGQGWIGASVHPKEDLPIGSHSTVYGTLYTGGILTFGTFVLAMALTAAAALRQVWQTARATPEHRRAEVGVALTACLVAYCPVESLFSLTLPCAFVFVFLGATLAPAQTTQAAIPLRPPQLR